MSDLIDRQQAIRAFDDAGFCSHDYVVGTLKDLPSAQPQQKKGKWIFHETENDRYDDMICPFCKKIYTVDAYRIDDIGFTAEDFVFCPNCGADMRGESE